MRSWLECRMRLIDRLLYGKLRHRLRWNDFDVLEMSRKVGIRVVNILFQWQ